MSSDTASSATTTAPSPEELELAALRQAYKELQEQKHALEMRMQKSEERRRALIHILSDLNQVNRKLADQRKAMIHILADYEHDRSRLAKQTERLDNSRRALMHILQDSHQSNIRLENSRKAMIHIMSDLRETTEAVQRREQELREKQEQLVQAGKLATLGELTTGVAHELNNPLNNIGLFIGNAIDLILLGAPDAGLEHSASAGQDGDGMQRAGWVDKEAILHELSSAMQQVRKATEIISHLRTFGRAAPVSFEPLDIRQVIERAISLVREQMRLRQIEVQLHFPEEAPLVFGNAIQLEQVFINLLTNARDALTNAPNKIITITCRIEPKQVALHVCDTGPGIPAELEQRIFDPFFTTKEVGTGTGLGLSITYGIIKDHQGTISVENRCSIHHAGTPNDGIDLDGYQGNPGEGAHFLVHLPRQG
jgi:C4-dicarboxylate-specific signal transduction histidine kinase